MKPDRAEQIKNDWEETADRSIRSPRRSYIM